MSQIRVTHIGGPTVLIEIDGWRLVTDPTFDPPGRHYAFGYGTGSRKTSGPAIAANDLLPVDAVLLSHDHHADNLDDAGRALLPQVGVVLTTVAGATRLGANARGLAPWMTTRLSHTDRPTLDIMATPCRHGPPLSGPIVGDVIGFALQWDGQTEGALWISGDTVWYAGIEQVAQRMQVGTALVHLGGVQFPITGPLRYTMTASDAVRVSQLMRPATLVPVHYEGWAHFRENRVAVERAFARAGAEDRARLRWLEIGEPADITV